MLSYSRRILWLKVGITNNNPRTIAHYYLECVKEINGDLTILVHNQTLDVVLFIGAPRLIRADCGTENSSVAFIQPFLRRTHGDCYAGFESFRYGKSVTNQVCS